MDNNKSWTLLAKGAEPDDIDNAMELNASISEDELNRGVWWEKMKSSKLTKLVIINFENISYTEQEKFARLLKDRRVGTNKLPEDIRIVIPVSNNADINPDIAKLCLIWDVH